VVGTNSFSETLQNTPITATEFAGAQLAEAQIDSLLKLPQGVPNFSQSHTGLRSFADNYVIRGLGNTDFLSDPAVVVYLDDAPFGDGISYTPDLLSVDHLEVYRGPQGSRFGKNAEAGVINIVSRNAIAKIPADRRRVITSHNAFGYFAAAYGFEFIAPLGVSTESEASARDIAGIITQIKTQKIPAVFLENISDPRLIRQIAAETGARIGGTLYSDSLTGEKGDAPTYIDMVRHNIRALTSALAN